MSNGIESLQQNVDTMVSSARSRARTTGTIMFIVVLALGGYYTWAYNKIQNEVKLDTLGAIAEGELNRLLPEAQDELTQALKDYAPTLMDMAAEKAMEGPRELKEWLIAYTVPEIKRELEKIVDELQPALETQLEELAAEFKNVPEAERGEKVMERLAEDFRTQVIAAIDQAHASFAGKLNERIDYIQFLAKNQGLNEREKIQRDLLQATVAVFEKWEELKPTDLSIEKGAVDQLHKGLPQINEDKKQ